MNVKETTNTKTKYALVTGAGGFIGLNIVSTLIEKDYVVYGLIRRGNLSSIDKLNGISNKINIINGFDELLVSKLPRFDVIYHCASVGVSNKTNDIDLILDVNVKMALDLVKFAKINNSGLLVNFGSCFEYGDHGNVLLNESMECRPKSIYAASKNACVNLTNIYARDNGVNLITVRPFGVFGLHENINRLAPSIISNCLRGIKTNTTLGEQIRDFVDVKDVSRAIIMLSEANYTTYEIYNICSNNEIRVKDFIIEILEVCNFNRDLINFGAIDYRDNEAMLYAGDNSKLQSLINYPFYSNHISGILDIFNEYK